jgi:hypothetical protein
MERDTFEVSFSANIRSNQGHGSLQVWETVDLPGNTFRDVSRVLERFHTFGDRMRAELAGEGQEDEPVNTAAAAPGLVHCAHHGAYHLGTCKDYDRATLLNTLAGWEVTEIMESVHLRHRRCGWEELTGNEALDYLVTRYILSHECPGPRP